MLKFRKVKELRPCARARAKMADISLPWFGGVKGETRLEHDVSTRDEGAAAFIAANLPLQPAPGLPQILHPYRDAGERPEAAGFGPQSLLGVVLGRRPGAGAPRARQSACRFGQARARSRRGSGLVGIAAGAPARERSWRSTSTDAIVAIGLNARQSRGAFQPA